MGRDIFWLFHIIIYDLLIFIIIIIIIIIFIIIFNIICVCSTPARPPWALIQFGKSSD